MIYCEKELNATEVIIRYNIRALRVEESGFMRLGYWLLNVNMINRKMNCKSFENILLVYLHNS